MVQYLHFRILEFPLIIVFYLSLRSTQLDLFSHPGTHRSRTQTTVPGGTFLSAAKTNPMCPTQLLHRRAWSLGLTQDQVFAVLSFSTAALPNLEDTGIINGIFMEILKTLGTAECWSIFIHFHPFCTGLCSFCSWHDRTSAVSGMILCQHSLTRSWGADQAVASGVVSGAGFLSGALNPVVLLIIIPIKWL